MNTFDFIRVVTDETLALTKSKSRKLKYWGWFLLFFGIILFSILVFFVPWDEIKEHLVLYGLAIIASVLAFFLGANRLVSSQRRYKEYKEQQGLQKKLIQLLKNVSKAQGVLIIEDKKGFDLVKAEETCFNELVNQEVFLVTEFDKTKETHRDFILECIKSMKEEQKGFIKNTTELEQKIKHLKSFF